MNVSAIIVTRGDVDLAPVLDSLPKEWEQVVWDNGRKRVYTRQDEDRRGVWDQVDEVQADLSVYGRYAAIEYASHDLVYVQDDDVIVSDPQAIAKAWVLQCARLEEIGQYQGIVANQPQEFRHEGYTDSCLVGFGACFHRDLPKRAFDRFSKYMLREDGWSHEDFDANLEICRRTCDVVFTTLTPRVLVDVTKENLDYAYGEDRMWRQPDHVGERARMLELARKVRDA